MPFATACQLSLNPITAKGLLALTGLQAGQTLLLTAANSSVGQLVVQLAARQHLHVVCLVRNPAAAETGLRSLGAAHVLGQDEADLPERIQRLTAQTGAAALLDAVGGPLLARLLSAMAVGGQVVLYGASALEPAAITNGMLVYRNLTLRGFGIDHWLAAQTPAGREQLFTELIDLVQAGQLQMPIASSHALQDFAAALASPATTGKRLLL